MRSSNRPRPSLVACVLALAAFALPAAAPAAVNWPASQLFPSFSTPAQTQDHINLFGLAADEQALFASLKGVVNATQPRIFSYEGDAFAEGAFTWLQSLGLGWTAPADRWTLITKYRTEIQGLVVYDQNQLDTMNLACVLASSRRALVTSPGLLARLQGAPYNLPILVDLRGQYANKLAVYQAMYNTYWPTLQHRILFGLSPQFHPAGAREYAQAIGAAVIWLDPLVAAENTLLSSFFSSMGQNGVYMGWWPQEGPGIEAASRFGIATVPSDYATNLTLHSGMSRTVNVKPVPAKPALQNRIYVAFILSDGDNLQFVEHLMRKLWNDPGRGQVPIGWTVSPSMLDTMPGALNYYYTSGTANDNLISGPSGFGYAYPNFMTQGQLDNYVTRTEDYTRRAGLKVVTVWNTITGGINANVGNTYALRAPSLLGLTAQNTGGGLTIYTNGTARIPGFALSCNYCTNEQAMKDHIASAAAGWNGASPRFILIQAQPWQGVTPTIFNNVKNSLSTATYTVLRPDNWFQLLREANGLPVNPGPTPTPVPQGPFGGTARTIANGSVIQAEDYDVGGPGVAYSDTTAGNASASYRADDVDIEPTTDTGAGFNIDWTVAGEWMEYTVNTTAGTYSITARVASASTAPADFRVLLDGVALGTFSTNATGGWQTWADLTISGVNITGGTNRILRIEVLNGNDCNLNYLRFNATATPTATARPTATATPTTRATATPTTRPAGQGPFGGVNRTIANGAVIQAEDYDVGGPGVAFSDTTAGNASAQYRADDVDIEVTTDTGGGYNVDWTVAGEWMEYTVNTTAGTYSITARVASASTAPADFRVLLDGVALGTFATAATGGWQTWVDLTISGVNITAGTNRVFRIEVLNGNDCNLNFVRFASSGPTPTATTRPTATATATATTRSTPTATTRATPTPTTRPRPTPTTGTGCAIGATCEAETALLGGGVVTSTLHAGYTGTGFADYQGNGTGYVEWTVNVPTAGTYNLNIRYGNGGTGDRPMSIQVNGTTAVSSMSFPVTGWTSWTVRTQSASLPAGTVRIRATELPNGPNVDSLVVTSSGGTAAWAPNVPYAVNTLVTYGGLTYRCIQAHTSQVGWEPPAAPSLWTPQ
jgi:hypothetical protein